MRRSAEFTRTVKCGVRAPQADLVVHAYRAPSGCSPRVGFVVAKSVGGAVDRHRVARKLRHAAIPALAELDPADRIVVRALPGSRQTRSEGLQEQLLRAVRRAQTLMGDAR